MDALQLRGWAFQECSVVKAEPEEGGDGEGCNFSRKVWKKKEVRIPLPRHVMGKRRKRREVGDSFLCFSRAPGNFMMSEGWRKRSAGERQQMPQGEP